MCNWIDEDYLVLRDKREPVVSVSREPLGMSSDRAMGPARTPNGLDAQSFFGVEQLCESGCGVNSDARRLRVASGWPASPQIARVVGWATAKWVVQAQLLFQ